MRAQRNSDLRRPDRPRATDIRARPCRPTWPRTSASRWRLLHDWRPPASSSGSRPRQGRAQSVQGDHPEHRQRPGATIAGPKPWTAPRQEAKGFLRPSSTPTPRWPRYKQLMYWQIAYTGQTAHFHGPATHGHGPPLDGDGAAGRDPGLVSSTATCTGSTSCRWSRTAGPDHLRPESLERTTGKLIYDHQRGRLSHQHYHLFDEPTRPVPAADPQLGLAEHPPGAVLGARKPSTRASMPRPARRSTSSARAARRTSAS